jgi:hypothetical protein
MKLEGIEKFVDSEVLSTIYEPCPEQSLVNDSFGRISNYKLCCYTMLASSTSYIKDNSSIFGSLTDDLTDTLFDSLGGLKMPINKDSQQMLISYLVRLVSEETNSIKRKCLVPVTINNSGSKVMTPFGMSTVPPEDLPINSNGILKDNGRNKFMVKMFTKRYEQEVIS